MDWGFKTFCPIKQLQDPGFLPDGELHIRVEMTVSLNRFCGGSRASTGYVGLKNRVRARASYRLTANVSHITQTWALFKSISAC